MLLLLRMLLLLLLIFSCLLLPPYCLILFLLLWPVLFLIPNRISPFVFLPLFDNPLHLSAKHLPPHLLVLLLVLLLILLSSPLLPLPLPPFSPPIPYHPRDSTPYPILARNYVQKYHILHFPN